MIHNTRTARLLTVLCMLASSVGLIAQSSTAAAQVPEAPPKAPTNVVATPTPNQITVTWDAPIDGPAVSSYLVVVQPIGATCERDAVVDGVAQQSFECTFTGLSNGEEYRVRVRSRNAIGATNAPTRRLTLGPQPATSLFALPADQSAVVRWSPPRGVGFEAAPGYVVRLTPQNIALAGADCQTETLECVFDSLVNAETYDVVVERTGLGVTSAAATTVTPSANAPTVVPIPGLPTDILALAGDGSISVTWTPATTGEPATDYEVTLDPGDHVCVTTGSNCEVEGLTNDTRYDVRLSARNAGGSRSTALNNVTPREAAPPIVAVRPARIYETRIGDDFVTADGVLANTGQRLPQRRTTIDVAGRLEIPEDAAAVVVNTTVIGPRTGGYVTLYPCSNNPPTASTINFSARQVIANSTVVKLSGRGGICVFSSARTDIAIDVTGYVPANSDIVTVKPARLFETRTGEMNVTIDGLQQRVGRSDAGEVSHVDIAGRGTLPDQMSAAILNVTVVNPADAGFVTLYPCDQPRPTTSVLNHAAGQTIATGATVKLGIDGDACVYTSAEAHVVVDFVGYAPTNSALTTVDPARLFDSRADGETVDGRQQAVGQRVRDQVTTIEVAGRANVPDDASTAIVSIAAIRPSGAGFITLFNCDDQRPLASSLNYAVNAVIANSATVKLDASGNVCLFTSSGAHVVIDVAGFVVE